MRNFSYYAVAQFLTIELSMQQTTIKSMFDRAYSTRLEERRKMEAPRASRKKNREIPLFYISLGMAVCVYVIVLAMAPSKSSYDDMFPNIHNPNMHQTMTVASQGSANYIHH